MNEPTVTLITGAAGGIGRALCHYLAARGHRLVLCDHGTAADGTGADPEVVRELAESLQTDVLADDGDISDDATAERCVDMAYAEFGRLDGAVHLAGFNAERSAARQSPELLRRTLAVHLEGPLHLLRTCAARWTKERSGGSLVLSTGATAFFGAARQSAMSAAQAGVVAAVRSAAVELRRYEIRVNAVAPTARTRLTEHLPLFQGISDGSMGPEQVAAVYGFLLSPASADISGEALAAAGNRLYALQSRETTGAFGQDGPFDEGEIAKRWDEIVRG